MVIPFAVPPILLGNSDSSLYKFTGYLAISDCNAGQIDVPDAILTICCYPLGMKIHLLIIDALNLIRRIHAVQGSPCLVGCQSAINQLIQHTQPTHAVAVFDEDDRHDSWRHQCLPDYKAGRSPMPDNLFAEMPTLKSHFQSMGLPAGTRPDRKLTIWLRR